MILLDKALHMRSLEPVYDYDGSVKILCKFSLPLSMGEVVRVALTPFGYVAVPLISAADRFFLGVSIAPFKEGEVGFVQIGGPASAFLGGEYLAGSYLSFDGCNFESRGDEPPYATKHDVLYIVEYQEGDTYKVFLFPREVIL